MINEKENQCPICKEVKLMPVVRRVKKFSYYHCIECDFIFIDRKILQKIDNGKQVFKYQEHYWRTELEAAKNRAWGSAVARMSECIHYCRIPINKFIDIGTGPGYFLDAIDHFLPASSKSFYGWEIYPPKKEFQTSHFNYLNCPFNHINHKFQAGLCMEVIEHLTPKQVYGLFHDLREKADEGALFIINTGLVDYVLNEDIDYLDPVKRGHICSWSVKALNTLLNNLGYHCYAIGKKTWAVAIEYQRQQHNTNEDITDRIWTILPENNAILEDPVSGSVIKILGLESARAYL